MNFRLVATGLAIHLSLTGLSMAAEPFSPVTYNAESAEREMLNRSFKIHLRQFENDWVEITRSNKGYFYGLNENGARNAYLERSNKLNEIFTEIFYDPRNPNGEQEKIVADLKAKMMLRHYYNQQCQSILMAYPHAYSPMTYTTPELYVIFTLEALAIHLKEYMVEQCQLLKDSHGIEVGDDITKTIQGAPLNDNYHEAFGQQLKELQVLGKTAYLQKLKEIDEELQRQMEEKRLEEVRRANEQKSKIPTPPSGPMPGPYQVRRNLLANNLAQALTAKRQELSTVKNDKEESPQIPKKKLNIPTDKQMPQNILSSIQALGVDPQKTLKRAGDRVLAEMVKQDEGNNVFKEFMEKMEKRRAAINPHKEDEEPESSK